eukprot:g2469.t1
MASNIATPKNPQDESSLLCWKRPNVYGDFPEARSGASITIMGNTAYVFGGLTKGFPPGPSDQLYTLKIGQSSFEWKIPKLKNDDPSEGPAKPKPKARWNHSAVLFGENCIFLFGGLHSGEKRLNDCWIFDSITQLWTSPEYLQQQNDLPSPRGGHTATMIGDDKMYVFGGFGGPGFARRELCDMYMLDMSNSDSMTWKKILSKGKVPSSRSGHCATATTKEKEHKIFIMGGWNCGEQFNDMWVFDVKSSTWSEMDMTIGIPRWNCQACAVEAIPNWKIFIFGGSCGDLSNSQNDLQGVYASDCSVIDTGDLQLVVPSVTGEPPDPRSDASVAYDQKGSRLIVFGGWANKWFSDVTTLDVGSIVGPPYAIFEIDPKMGPVTGGIEVRIIGQDFVNRPPITVRFATRTDHCDAEGEYVSSELMTCKLPSFEQFGAKQVQVRCALRGDSFTTTYKRFTFFNVTDHSKCVAFGPALINGCPAESQALFHIQAVDTENKYRQSGGDIFNVVVQDAYGVTLQHDIRDNENGDYLVLFRAGVAGKYTIEIDFDGTFKGEAGPLRGSPFEIDFVKAAPTDTDLSRMDGSLVTDDLKKKINMLLDFSRATLEGMKREVERGDIPTLTIVKEHLMNVSVKQEELQIGVDTCAATISFLGKFELPWLRDVVVSLDEVQSLWEKAKEQAAITAIRIAPLVQDASLTIKVDLAEYEVSVADYLDNHRRHDYWKSKSGFKKAFRMIEEGREKHREQLEVYKKQLHIATVFEFPELLEHSNEMLSLVEKEMGWLQQFWEFEESWQTRLRLMGMALWTELDGRGMEESSKELLKELKVLPEEIKWCDAYEVLEKTISDFTVACPLIRQLTDKAMRKRHWDKLGKLIKKTFIAPYKDKMCPVSQIINLNLHEHIGDVEDVTDRARKEAKIENTLSKLEDCWGDLEFNFKEFVDVANHKLKIANMTDEDFHMLENDQLTVQGILASKFADFFLEKLAHWHGALDVMVKVVLLIEKTTKVWTYLEPLFQGSEEVKKELPMDSQRFEKIDREIKQVLRGAYMTKIVKQFCSSKMVKVKLEEIDQNLAACKQSLGQFMEGKRGQFPRFYFVSEGDLLHLLANGSRPPKLLPYVPKIFPTLRTLVLEEEEAARGTNEVGTQYRVMEFVSKIGKETVALDPTVKMTGKPEIYLNEILQTIRATLSTSLTLSLKRYGKLKRSKWLMDKKKGKKENGIQKMSERNKDCAQIVLLVSAVMFTSGLEKAFKNFGSGDKGAMNNTLKMRHNQLADLILIARGKLSICDRMRVQAMIVKDAHYRDIVHRLIKAKAVSVNDFMWKKQMRYKFNAEKGVTVHTMDCRFRYGYEYSGNGTRLVVTALTDRAYLTMTQAIYARVGVAPTGPAGTGKTSTTQDLCVALGQSSYVFVGTPETDYKSVAEIFKGIAADGTWGCLDEFDRIAPHVLSVCALHLKSLYDAIRAEEDDLMIEGTKIVLKTTCAVFLTLNPDYRGRQPLPETFRINVRPVAIYLPDTHMIYEITLMSLGFQQSKELADKIHVCFQMLGDYLSPRRHYDWGLRTGMSMLRLAGETLRAIGRDKKKELTESDIILRCIRDLNSPKLASQDSESFKALLGDLFPGLNPLKQERKELEKKIAGK